MNEKPIKKSIIIDLEAWELASAAAQVEGSTIKEIVERSIRRYVESPDFKRKARKQIKDVQKLLGDRRPK